MKKQLLALLCAYLPMCILAQVQVPEPLSFTLDNGLKVYLIQNAGLGRAIVSLSLDIDDKIAASSSVTPYNVLSTMLRGTMGTNRTKDMQAMLSHMNATVTTNYKSVYIEIDRKFVENAVQAAAMVATIPSLTPIEFCNALDKEYKFSNDNIRHTQYLASRVSNKLVFDKKSFDGQIGTMQAINDVTLDTVTQIYKRYWIPNMARLIIVGSIDINYAKHIAKEYFGKWEAGERPVVINNNDNNVKPTTLKPKSNVIENPIIHVVDVPTASNYTTLNITQTLSLPIDDMQLTTAASIGVNVLKGRISTILKRNHINQKFSVEVNPSPVAASLVFTMTLPTTQVGWMTKTYLKELTALTVAPVSTSELNSGKQQLHKTVVLSVGQIARMRDIVLKKMCVFDITEHYFSKYDMTVMRTTARQVLVSFRQLIQPENAVIVAAGDAQRLNKKVLYPYTSLYHNPDGYLVSNSVYRERKAQQLKYRTDSGMYVIKQHSNAKEIMEKYIEELGGNTIANGVSTLEVLGSANVSGTEMNFSRKYDIHEHMFAESFSKAKKVESKHVISDQGAYAEYGGVVTASAWPEKENLEEKAAIVPEIIYIQPQLGYKYKMLAPEDVDGFPCIVVEVTSPMGRQLTNYYDGITGLKRKNIDRINLKTSTMQYTEVTTYYREYKYFANNIKAASKIFIDATDDKKVFINIKAYSFNKALSVADFEVKIPNNILIGPSRLANR